MSIFVVNQQVKLQDGRLGIIIDRNKIMTSISELFYKVKIGDAIEIWSEKALTPHKETFKEGDEVWVKGVIGNSRNAEDGRYQVRFKDHRGQLDDSSYISDINIVKKDKMIELDNSEIKEGDYVIVKGISTGKEDKGGDMGIKFCYESGQLTLCNMGKSSVFKPKKG